MCYKKVFFRDKKNELSICSFHFQVLYGALTRPGALSQSGVRTKTSEYFSVMLMVATAIKLDANYNPSYMEYKRSFPNSRIFGLAYNANQLPVKRNFLDQVKARMPFKDLNVKQLQDALESIIEDFKLLSWDTNYGSGVTYHDPYRGF